MTVNDVVTTAAWQADKLRLAEVRIDELLEINQQLRGELQARDRADAAKSVPPAPLAGTPESPDLD